MKKKILTSSCEVGALRSLPTTTPRTATLNFQICECFHVLVRIKPRTCPRIRIWFRMMSGW